jgi:fructose/tagatose bisphosphate aldolase
LFNESPNQQWVMDAIDTGFNLVMFTDERMVREEQAAIVRQVAAKAHGAGCAVEAEMIALPGLAGHLREQPPDLRLTDPDKARVFVQQTGVDALAVNIGQLHLHRRQTVRLDLDRLDQLRRALDVPLVLHGASSIHRDDLVAAIKRGVRKINVGSVLKQAYYNAVKAACSQTAGDANPYEVIGSGLAPDVLMAGRLAMQQEVAEYMHLFGSAGRAGGFP